MDTNLHGFPATDLSKVSPEFLTPEFLTSRLLEVERQTTYPQEPMANPSRAQKRIFSISI